MRAVPRLCELYPGICLATEEKAWINLSQGSPRVPIYGDIVGEKDYTVCEERAVWAMTHKKVLTHTVPFPHCFI